MADNIKQNKRWTLNPEHISLRPLISEYCDIYIVYMLPNHQEIGAM